MDASDKIAITGVGLITPLGHSAWENYRKLLSGHTISDRLQQHPDMPAFIDEVDLVQRIGSTSISHHTGEDPCITLAERVAREALSMANLLTDTIQQHERIPMMTGVSKGAAVDWFNSLHASREHPDQFPRIDSPDFLPTFFPVDHVNQTLVTRLPVNPIRSIVSACSASLIALHEARHMILRGETDRVLVLTTEAALLPIYIHSYRRLGTLATLTPQAYRCTPLDEKRSGFTLNESAAAVVLQRTDSIPAQTRPLAYLQKTAVACEAHHMILRPDHCQAFTKLIHNIVHDDASQNPIDLIHPHATGTPENDAWEMRHLANAIQDIQPHQTPDIYAIKGAIGHGMGASGLSALTIGCLISKANQRPPMPWLQNPITGHTLYNQIRVTPNHTRPIKRQAFFAAGFGGHLAGAAIQSV